MMPFTSFVPTSIRRLKHIPSTDVPGWTTLLSIRIVMRAHCSFSTAWFGQQSIGAGIFGGATRRDRSRTRQSPRGSQGGERHVSCRAGTHTSLVSHPFVTFDFRQFLRPHQMLEHFGLPLSQMHELQLCSSATGSACVPEPIGWYGDREVEFRHTDFGSDKTGERTEGYK